jgi:hypothetical protein
MTGAHNPLSLSPRYRQLPMRTSVHISLNSIRKHHETNHYCANSKHAGGGAFKFGTGRGGAGSGVLSASLTLSVTHCTAGMDKRAEHMSLIRCVSKLASSDQIRYWMPQAFTQASRTAHIYLLTACEGASHFWGKHKSESKSRYVWRSVSMSR